MTTGLPTLTLPLTRGDCADGPRPCRHSTCRHHLSPRRETASCALDVADEGPASTERIAVLLNLSPSGVRRLEARALRSASAALDGVAQPVAPEREPAEERVARRAADGEYDRIRGALEETRGNRSRAAALLGIPRRSFYRRIRELDAAPPRETRAALAASMGVSRRTLYRMRAAEGGAGSATG